MSEMNPPIPTSSLPVEICPSAPAISTRADLLEQLDDDQSLLARMAALFRANTPLLMDDIRRALAAQDAPAIARAAHALLGSLGIFGAKDAHRLTLQVEEHGIREDFAGVARAFAALEHEAARIDAAMESLACGEPNAV